jgi:enoyl-CoA hydratase/carnithine racemase
VERRGAVAIVTLNNPQALNALTAPMGDRFVQVLCVLAFRQDVALEDAIGFHA